MTRSTLIQGDVVEALRSLPGESVDCCVTSPPYWNLRSYDQGIPGQLGQEPTIDDHVDVIAGVFQEVHRVLKSTGTLWVNYGDAHHVGRTVQTSLGPLRNGDLLMMGFRVSLGLQRTGWRLRSRVVWHKPNVQPGRPQGRPVMTYEEVFLFAKDRNLYDWEAVRDRAPGSDQGPHLRNLWTIPKTNNGKGFHFATFPEDLPRRCIRAGSSEHGCCPGCGTPWTRDVEPTPDYAPHLGKSWGDRELDVREGRGHFVLQNGTRSGQRPPKRSRNDVRVASYRTAGWSLDCPCPDLLDPTPSVVLDPFLGSGTTGIVAHQEGRSFVGIDLSPTYLDLARKRIEAAGGRPEVRFSFLEGLV